MIDAIRSLVPNARFAPPASSETVALAEQRLGLRLPAVLRDLYTACDGFREPLGNAPYLLPLLTAGGAGTLVGVTLMFWNEWPIAVDLQPFVFFGMAGGNEFWGMRHTGDPKLILYHHHMEDEYEEIAGTVLDAYAADQAAYGPVAD